MKIYRLLCVAALSLACLTAFGQEVETVSEPVEIDYDQPQTYIVGGVLVDGNTHFAAQQIISLTGLQKGMKLTVPSDDITSILQRLWGQRYFEDVAMEIDHLSEGEASSLNMFPPPQSESSRNTIQKRASSIAMWMSRPRRTP